MTARILLALSLAGVVALPSTARAHAHLKRSLPAAGTSVSAPSALRLWFTEAPELALTRVTLLDSAGAVIPLAPPAQEPEGAMGVRARILRALAPGRYTVRWSTAAADGHPSSGSFVFRVEPAAGAATMSTVTAPATPSPPGNAATAEESPSPALSPTDSVTIQPAAVFTRAVWLGAIVVLLGAITFRLFILGRAGAFDEDGHDAASARLADWALLVGAIFLAAAVARLYLQTVMVGQGLASSPAPTGALLMDTRWGIAWRTQFGAGVLAVLGLLAARRRFAAGWWVAAAAGLVIAVGAALGGHAAADRFGSVAVADDALHILGASGWLGSLFWVLVIGTISLRSVRHEPAHRVAMLVHSFSPIALACGALVALSGIGSAWMRLGSFAAFGATPYGRVLLVKLALVAGAGAVGFYNWRRLRPSLGSDTAAARLRRSATAELILGAAVVVATALLVGLPTPVAGMR